eukprot:s6825_g2.t1
MKSFVIAIINDYTGLCYHLLLEALGSLCWHSRVARGGRPAKSSLIMMMCCCCTNDEGEQDLGITLQHALEMPREDRRFFEITIQRDSLEDRLGLDVVHYPGFLEVRNIFPDCAVDRHNRLVETRTLGTCLGLLLPNDYIHGINGVEGDEKKILDRCKTDKYLKIRVPGGRA